jgi:putative AlgH/UPF0301 family transcriptional regulator
MESSNPKNVPVQDEPMKMVLCSRYCCLLFYFLLSQILTVSNGFQFNLFAKPRLQNSKLRHKALPDGPIYGINDIPQSVRPAMFTGSGCVLLSQPNEIDQELYHSVILVVFHDNDRGSSGVMLDVASPFTGSKAVLGFPEFYSNRLFKGGSAGPETAYVLHKYNLQYAKYLGYGIYSGGLVHACQLLETRQALPTDFKIIFSSVEWNKGQLEQEVENGKWDVCHLPLELILDQKIYDKRWLWTECRKVLRSSNRLLQPDDL